MLALSVLWLGGCASQQAPQPEGQPGLPESREGVAEDATLASRHPSADLEKSGPAARQPVQPASGAPVPEGEPQEAGDTDDTGDTGEEDPDAEPLLDRTQQTVFSVVNSTSQWFDGFFGSAILDVSVDEDTDVTRGLLALGVRYDERDQFDTTTRFRARFPLTALKKRTRLLLGRGDTDDLVDGTESETINTLPDQFNDFPDDDWLLGIGYSRKDGLRNGFDFSAGASIRSSGLDPYVRVSYRWNALYGDALYWRLRPRIYWQEQRGEGVSLSSILDYVAGPRWLLRSWTTVKTDDQVEGMGWRAEFLAYNSLTDDAALSYRFFGNGETRNAVTLQDYGFEVRYRRRILRRWLYLELSSGISWPREFVDERRESNLGVGVEVEMQFGDWPGRKQKRPEPDD